MITAPERIHQLEIELSLLELPYGIAVRRQRGEDQDWEERKKALIRQLCELAKKYNIGDEPHKAVAICAQMSVLARELSAPETIVTEYEEKRQILNMAREQEERRQEAAENARIAAEQSRAKWGGRREAV